MPRPFVVAIILLGVVALAGTVDRGAAQDRRVPASPADIRLSYAPIVQRVQPAVVNVYAAKVVRDRNPLLDDPIFRRFFGVPGQQPEQMQRSLGSGVTACNRAPSHGLFTALPPFLAEATTTRTMLAGIAKPMPCDPPEREKIAVLTPASRPVMSTSAPPELPGLIAASV